MTIQKKNHAGIRVSVVMPFRNASSTLKPCLQSIRGQTMAEFELLAINDGSSDASDQIIRSIGDPRFRVIDNRGQGLVSALNLGIDEARSPLVARMDADDIMLPCRLARQVEWLDNNPRATLVSCQVERMPEDSPEAGFRYYLDWQNSLNTHDRIAQGIYVESPFVHPSVCYRRDAVLCAGGYQDGDFPEDYDLWLRLVQSGCLTGRVPEVLLRWRHSVNGLTFTDRRYRREAFDHLRARYIARDPRIRSQRPLLCWGAGRKTRQRARLLYNHGIRFHAWIDIDPRKIGRRHDDTEVISPSCIKRFHRPFVLVYVTNHGAREQIAESLVNIGMTRGEDFLAVG